MHGAKSLPNKSMLDVASESLAVVVLKNTFFGTKNTQNAVEHFLFQCRYTDSCSFYMRRTTMAFSSSWFRNGDK